MNGLSNGKCNVHHSNAHMCGKTTLRLKISIIILKNFFVNYSLIAVFTVD